MSNWAKIMACMAVLVCCLINLSLIQFAAGDSAIYKELKLATDEKEVEAILKNAPYKKDYVIGGLTVGYMEKMSSPLVNVDLCEPFGIKNLALLVSRFYGKLPKSLEDYLNHHFQRLIPVCVGKIEDLFVSELSWRYDPPKKTLEYFKYHGSEEGVNFYELSRLVDLCNTVCKLKTYVNNMNFYEENITIEQKVKLYGEFSKYMDVCEIGRACY